MLHGYSSKLNGDTKRKKIIFLSRNKTYTVYTHIYYIRIYTLRVETYNNDFTVTYGNIISIKLVVYLRYDIILYVLR